MEREEGGVEAETIAGLAWGEGEGLGLGHFELLGLRVELVGGWTLGLLDSVTLGLLAVPSGIGGPEGRRRVGGGGRVGPGWY